MKFRFPSLLLLAALLVPALHLQAEFEPPTEGELDQLLANPQLINVTIKDANGQEAAGVMLRVIGRLQEAELVDAQLHYLVAFYTARIAFLLPDGEATTFATELVNTAPPELVPPILAALSLGAGGVPGFGNHLADIAGDDEIRLQAIRNPRIPLTPPVYNLLVAALGTTQTLPPVVTDSLPPPIPVGEQPPEAPSFPPPFIPDTYDGQG